MGAITAATVAATVAIAPQAAAADPPPRENTRDRPVIFVHGFQFDEQADCDMWNETKKAFVKDGWDEDNLITWAYYSGSKNCDEVSPGSVNTSLSDVGEALRKYIATNFGSRGQSVDVVTHSTGGLVIRDAIIKSNQNDTDVFVEDVVTLGAPNEGSGAARACKWFYTQCEQLSPGSGYLNALNANSTWDNRLHEARGGTEWTAVGSYADTTVSDESATALWARNKVIYEGLGHSDYYQPSQNEGEERLAYSHNYGSTWEDSVRGIGSIKQAVRGAYIAFGW